MKIHRTHVALCSAAFLAFASALPADTYDHSGHNGSLTDGQWLNQTVSPPNVYGNPGAADDAYFYASTITGSGGSVHLLSGGNLQLSGMVSATNVATLDLSGDGTLNVQSIVTDANGFGPTLSVTGGHLMAQNGDGVTNVTAGGTVVDATCSGTNGCGFFDGGSSLMITGAAGPGRVILANASTLVANGALSNFTLQIASGSTAQVPTMTDGLLRIDGTGSHLTVNGAASLNSQSLNITNGGAAMVNGNLTQLQGTPLRVSGSGSSLTVGGDLMHNTASDTDVNLDSGAMIRVQGNLRQVRGQVQADGANTTLTVDQIFSCKAGFVDVSNGATLSANSELILDGGTDLDGDHISGGGNWNGASTINVSGPMFIGDSATGGSSFSLAVVGSTKVHTAAVTIGSEADSRGTVGLSGSGTVWEVQTGAMSVGGSGTGNFNIGTAAHLLLDSGTGLAVGFDSGSHGTMTADGNGSVIDASAALVSVGKMSGSVGNLTLSNQASLLLGRDTFIGDSGSGSLNINSGSQVALTGAQNKFGVGNEAGSQGSVSVQDAGSSLTSAGPMIVGVFGNGFLGAGGGAQVVLTSPDGLGVGGAAGAMGTVVLDGDQTSLTTPNLVDGQGGMGQMTISNGAILSVTGPDMIVGGQSGSNGSLLVTGTNSVVSAQTNFPITVGEAGAGAVAVAAGARFFSNVGVEVAVRNGSTGSISVSDAGSLFDAPSISFGDLPIPGFPSDGGAGSITVQDSGQLRADNSFDIRASTANPSVIINNGQIAVGSGDFGPAGSLRISQGGVLLGNPQAIRGQVIVGLGGRISPGNSPGIIAIDGNYQQDAGSTFQAEIGGPNPGTGYDQITATGSATFGGNLTVRLVNGFTPAVGQTFRIVTAGSTSGTFASISQPSQAGISLTSDATGVTVTVTSVVAGAPVISSATTAGATVGTPFSYQIAATNNPTNFGAMSLPEGLMIDQNTGVISGTPTGQGVFIIPINANNAAGSGLADLTLMIGANALAAQAQLQNISTRGLVMTNEKVLIGGFIITGTAPKQVIIRGLGPSLNINGTPVPGRLANPTLKLMQGDTPLASNDTWTSDRDAIMATGLAPSDDTEAAIVTTLAPGNYTAILSGEAGTTGIGLVEIYDLDPASGSQLGNISTRGYVETGDQVLIGGFIIGPSARANGSVLIRAIGPSMNVGGVPVPGRLADPTLDLVNANGTVIGSNDDWKSSQQAQIEATDLAPTDDKESALIAPLAPGNYTAIVRGVGQTTGIALVEIYRLP